MTDEMEAFLSNGRVWFEDVLSNIEQEMGQSSMPCLHRHLMHPCSAAMQDSLQPFQSWDWISAFDAFPQFLSYNHVQYNLDFHIA